MVDPTAKLEILLGDEEQLGMQRSVTLHLDANTAWQAVVAAFASKDDNLARLATRNRGAWFDEGEGVTIADRQILVDLFRHDAKKEKPEQQP